MKSNFFHRIFISLLLCVFAQTGFSKDTADNEIMDRDTVVRNANTAFKEGNANLAYKLLLPLAENDDPEAQGLVGIMLGRNIFTLGGETIFSQKNWAGVTSDNQRGRYFIEKAASRGDPLAKYYLGLMLLKQAKMEPEKAAGWRHIRESGAQGYDVAEYFLALHYLRQGRELKAIGKRKRAITAFAHYYKWSYLFSVCNKFTASSDKKSLWPIFSKDRIIDYFVINREQVLRKGRRLIRKWEMAYGATCLTGDHKNGR